MTHSWNARNITTIDSDSEDDDTLASNALTKNTINQDNEDFPDILTNLISEELTQHDTADHSLREGHASFVVEYLSAEEKGLIESEDVDALLHVASQINAPHGDPRNCKAYVAMHWAPVDEVEDDSSSSDSSLSDDEPPDEWACPTCTFLNVASVTKCAMLCGGERPAMASEKKKQNNKRPATLKISGKRAKRRKGPSRLRQQYPQQPWDTIIDPGSFSIDIMLKLFPELGSECLTQDIYSRRRPITRDGKRLHGTDPYSFNKGISLHHAYSCSTLEASAADAVLLVGKHVKDWFVENYGQIKDNMVLGGRMRRVFYMDHPEYVGIYSPRDRLEKTLSTLQAFSTASGVQLDLAWLRDQISRRGSPENKPPSPRIKVPKKAVDASRRLLKRCEVYWSTPGNREAAAERTRAHFAKPGVREHRSAVYKANLAALWKDPEYRRKTTQAIRDAKTPANRALMSRQFMGKSSKPMEKTSQFTKPIAAIRKLLPRSLVQLGFRPEDYGIKRNSAKPPKTNPFDTEMLAFWSANMTDGGFISPEDLSDMALRHDKEEKVIRIKLGQYRSDFKIAERVVARCLQEGVVQGVPLQWHSRAWEQGADEDGDDDEEA